MSLLASASSSVERDIRSTQAGTRAEGRKGRTQVEEQRVYTVVCGVLEKGVLERVLGVGAGAWFTCKCGCLDPVNGAARANFWNKILQMQSA